MAVSGSASGRRQIFGLFNATEGRVRRKHLQARSLRGPGGGVLKEVKETLSVPMADSSAEFRPRRAQIVALRTTPDKRELELPRGRRRLTIGSHQDCDLVIADPYVSAMHCLLERRDDGTTIVHDRGSKNGTLLNGNRVEVAEVTAGTLLTLGRTVLVALGASGRTRTTAFEQLIGDDPGFRGAVDMAIRAASSECSVLIAGETGTGKELVARAVHDASHRAAGPFVPINCGAIPRELIASELFGHRRGAFTGADTDREGVFAKAHGGSLFLDEIGELPLEQQPHLLRVLESGMIRRVGDESERPVEVRTVAATNRLTGLGEEGARLRVDLYHRLATVVVALPPLRERRGDIPALVAGFLRELAATHGERRIAPSTLRRLMNHPWPGNVRQLRHSVHRAIVLCPNELTAEALMPTPPIVLTAAAAREPHRRTLGVAPPPKEVGAIPSLAQACHATVTEELRPYELVLRDAMCDALAQTGSIRAAAAAIGMAKSTFADRARRYGIETKRR